MMITAMAGGVGAAKFLSGLVKAMPPEEIIVVVNTGDDFRWMGLYICPDLDTVTYTLAGIANPGTGWGVEGDTFQFLAQLKGLGEDAWFRVGDRDLATHECAVAGHAWRLLPAMSAFPADGPEAWRCRQKTAGRCGMFSRPGPTP